MSRIAFFSERLPPDQDPISLFSYDLMCGLAEQQHDVRIFSTYSPDQPLPPQRQRIEILRPFKSWSWLELPRVLPLMFEFQPDIIHLIQPREEAMTGFTNAMSAISNFAPLMGRPVVVTSFYDLKQDHNKKLLQKYRSILSASDIVTVTTHPQLELLEKHFASVSRRPQVRLLPIPDSYDHESTISIDLEDGAVTSEINVEFLALQEFLNQNHQLIFVPFDIDQHRDPSVLFQTLSRVLLEFSRAAVVFGGGWGRLPPLTRHHLMSNFEQKNIGSRVYIGGPLSTQELRTCLKHTRVALVAGLPIESLRLTAVIREALASATPLIMTHDQAALGFANANWQNQTNALLVDWPTSENSGIEAVYASLKLALSSDELMGSIRARLPEFARAEVQDKPGNVMSRIYAESLLHKKRMR